MKEALHLALPIIAGQLGQILMGFFDTVQIGGLGHEYIAGSGFANNIYWMISLLGMGVLFAVSTLVSEVRGEKETYKAIGIYRSGIKVALFLSVFFTALLFVVMNNIHWLGQNEKVNELAIRFLRIVIWSTVFVFLFTAAKQLLDGLGRTKVGMVITIGGLLLNITLNWTLIYGHLGFLKMEIEGAAWATSISRVLMTLAFLIVIWRDKQIRELRKEYLASIHGKYDYLKEIFVIGIPAGLQFFWEVAAFGAANVMSGWLGIEYEASHQIAIGLASITFMVVTGVAAAGNILTGYSYGEKDREGIRIAGNTVFIITLAFEAVFAIFFLTCHSILPELYTSNAQVISIASSVLLLAALFQVSDGLQVVAANALRGMQDVKIPAIIAFVSYWVVMVPMCYILAFKFNLGLRGVWIGFIIGLTLAAVLQLGRFRWIVSRIEFKEV